MRASILYCTARSEPRFDWLNDSLLNAGIADHDVELLVIDAKLWGGSDVRRGQFERCAEGLRAAGVQITHIPPKPSRWQGPARLTKSDYFALANARNTGLIVARGQRIIALDDCSVVDRGWLTGHLGWPDDVLVAGSFFTYKTAIVKDGVVQGGDQGAYGPDPRQAQAPTPGRTNGGWMYGLSSSYPVEAAVRVNGSDELYDSQGGSEDCDFGVRMERAGFACFWDPRIIIYQVLETHEAVLEHSGWGLNQAVKRKPKELKVRRDGQMHFANEVLIERLCLDELDRYLPLGNNFSIAEMRSHYERTHEFLPVQFDPVDWRDGQQLSEME